MAISIRVGDAVEPEVATGASEVPSVPIKFNLKMRRTLDNNIIISDHPDIDIVIMLGTEEKIVLFPKEVISDIVYDTQNRFFRFLRKKGIIDPETVRGGNVYGSMEGSILGASEQDQFLPLVIFNISKFVDEERPYFEYVEKYKQMEDDEMLDPTPAESTELGEVPQAAEKGGIRPGYGRVSPYFLSYML